MASQTINGGITFAEGTSVGAYPATQIGPNGGPPSGSATTTATVTGGVLSFTGLADGTEYVAYAAGPDRYKRFRTDPASSISAGGGRTASTAVSSATPTIATSSGVTVFEMTAQAVDITSMSTNLTGTPARGDMLLVAITGTAARAITWGASFESGATTLPTTTVGTSRLDVVFIWNPATSKWRCLSAG